MDVLPIFFVRISNQLNVYIYPVKYLNTPIKKHSQSPYLHRFNIVHSLGP